MITPKGDVFSKSHVGMGWISHSQRVHFRKSCYSMSLELVALLGVICFVLVMRLLNPSKWVHESIVIV